MDPISVWLIAGSVISFAFILVGLVAVNCRAALDRPKLTICNGPMGEGR